MVPAINGASNSVVRMSEPGSVYRRLPGHHILWIEGGNGIYQVDFQNYSYTGERILFLEPGQYFRVLTGAFTLKEIAVPSSLLTQHPDLAAASRVLFTQAGFSLPWPAYPRRRFEPPTPMPIR